MKFDHRKLLLLALAGAIILVPTLRTGVLPLLLALVLAMVMQRPVQWLRHHRIPPPLGTLLLMLSVLAPLLAAAIWGVQWALRWAGQLPDLLPALNTLEDTLDNWLYRRITALSPAGQAMLRQALDVLIERRQQLFSAALSWIGSVGSGWLSALPSHLAAGAIFLLALFFCCVGYRELADLGRVLLPPDWVSKVEKLMAALREQLSCWARAERSLVTVIFLELALGLGLLRMKSWLLFAAVIALVDLIPLVGSGLILIPWAGLVWLRGEPLRALGVALLWLMVWGTRTMLEPRLLGKRLQIPTALSFCAALLGARLWGFQGLILAPVGVALGVRLLREQTLEDAG